MCFFNLKIKAQTAEADIKKTISTLFTAMTKVDSSLAKTVIDVNCTLQSVAIVPGKQAKHTTEKIHNFIKSIGTVRPNMALEERLLSYQINIDEALAVAWTPYEFYINNKLSHSGTNVFTLVKLPDGWKIVSIIDTRKK
jgi:hypothetical protein